MVFSSPTFLFLYLPILLFVYLLTPVRFKNLVLLLASLFFYAWGEGLFVIVMLASIAMNYLFGLVVQKLRHLDLVNYVVAAAVTCNLGLLVALKYANFIADNLSFVFEFAGLPPLQLAPVHLPIGISFFTFQAMSYVIDIRRREADAQRNPITVALYISLFPQLIAGPIVRYHDVATQLISRKVDVEMFGEGVRRFIIGFCKKMLIANPLGEVADTIFALPGSSLSPEVAWLGIICYTLQIYFDFSGYSDMAIGLGRMFGFRFLENFNFPYISRSIREFWRRWHISLSNWFRDYLYIPLGGNRTGEVRTYFNLVIVFVLCGFWHGASWNFLIWGLIHGMFLVLERVGLGAWIDRAPSIVRHVYVLAVVMFAWVFFRAETLPEALAFLFAMTTINSAAADAPGVFTYLSVVTGFTLMIGIVAATPIYGWLTSHVQRYSSTGAAGLRLGAFYAFHFSLFALAITALAADTYNPFIYFRF